MFYKAPNTYINEGCQFTVDGTVYPANWLNLSTPEDKAALGLEEVVITGDRMNPEYYWTGETLDGATLTLTATPKDLNEVKTACCEKINQIAYSLLLPSDWRAHKAYETDTAMDPAWKTWRAAVRAVVAETETKIKACKKVDTVEAAMNAIVWPVDPSVEV